MSKPSEPLANPWGGRFSEAMTDRLIRFNTSLPTEERLFPYDVKASIAHVKTLERAQILSAQEAATLVRGLEEVLKDWQAGKVELKVSLEDLHMNLEVLLQERVGEVAKKVHSARSRNDQQAVAQRLYFKDSTRALAEAVRALQKAVLGQAKRHGGLLMPSYTHLQRAEFTSYGHWLSTYVVMLERDRSRLLDAVERADECPLGACASTGTSLPLDRAFTAQQLGFQRATLHSIDSVSDRDYLVELGAAAALLMVHLSRMSEELILFTSQEFGFLKLADRHCTGSSIMPQKKNPDIPELVRGKSAQVIGGAVALLTLTKGLPLGYNKDLQEDKKAWFDLYDHTLASVEILTELIEGMAPVDARMAAATKGGHIVATEYANYLVRKGMPFRQAHEVVGTLVRRAEQSNVDLAELPLSTLREASPLFEDDIVSMSPATWRGLKNSVGGCGDKAMEALWRELDGLLSRDARHS